MGDVIKEWAQSPDNLTKVFFAFNIGLILTNFIIAIGALILVFSILGYL